MLSHKCFHLLCVLFLISENKLILPEQSKKGHPNYSVMSRFPPSLNYAKAQDSKFIFLLLSLILQVYL